MHGPPPSSAGAARKVRVSGEKPPIARPPKASGPIGYGKVTRTQVWMVELTFDERPEGGLMELFRLYSSDDTAILEVGDERPHWQLGVILRDAPPMPWRGGAALRFALVGQPPGATHRR